MYEISGEVLAPSFILKSRQPAINLAAHQRDARRCAGRDRPGNFLFHARLLPAGVKPRHANPL